MKNIAILLVLLCCGSRTLGQVNADFTSSPARGCAPLTVRFTNTSTGNIDSIFWDFGQGTTSVNNNNPGVTYDRSGTYTVKLRVKGPGGEDSVIRVGYVIVNELPTVAFTYSDSAGCFPLRVNFTDQSTAVSNGINGWEWDFGDGTISTQQNPSHTYTISGDYTVTLRVFTSDGCTNTLSKQQKIQVAPGVRADFFVPLPNACKPPVTLPITNLSAGPGTITYNWNFGNGTSSTDASPRATYTQAGDFTITLVATSSSGCTDTMRKTVTIPQSTVTSSFTAVDTACIRQAIRFSNTSIPSPDSTFWSFGDGTIGSSYDFTKTYTRTGTFSVRMLNKFGTCLDSTVRNIVIVDTPVARFIQTNTNACQPPFTVRFTDQSPGAVRWVWNFGDGTTSTEQNPVKTYTSFGNFTVRLQIFNRFGCSSTSVQENLVRIARPVFNIRNLPDSGCAPFTIRPDIEVIAVDGVSSYSWDFGDGTIMSGAAPSHTYAATGNYTIKLTVTTRGGCRDSVIVSGIKVGNVGNVADFTATPLSLCAGEPVTFTDLSTGNVTGWLWDFGGGGQSIEQNPTHVYADTGKFTVSLTVFNNGCEAEAIKVDYITVRGAVARFTPVIDCNNKRRVTFLDSSINVGTRLWNFGDGTTSTAVSPVHTYATFGSYTVSLTVSNGGCVFTSVRTVKVVNERAQHIVTPDPLCSGVIATYQAINSLDSNIRRYEWDYGGGFYSDGARSVDLSLFGAKGRFTTRLRITDVNGCQDSSIRDIFIGGPTVRFGATNPTGCKGITVRFVDSSRSDGISNIISRVWHFGDGTVQTVSDTTVSHTYPRAGNYSVKLVITDAAGCKDSLFLPNFVVATDISANFTVSDSATCPGKPVQFFNQSPASIGNFLWTFGDGTTSTLRNPAHVFTQAGNFNVKLRIRDRFGCEDSITRNSVVVVDTPFAAFTVSDSVGTCPPLLVRFTFTGKYASSVRWDFGDGSPSELTNPEHNYTLPGTYIARLIVTSPGGCTDTAFQTIRVFGPNGTVTYSPAGGCTPLTVNFQVRTQNVDTIIWDFDDGTLIETKDSLQTHTYNISKNYVPRITLQDNVGCQVSLPVDTIKVISITPRFGSDIRQLCDRGPVQFRDSSFSNGRFTNWLWNFGDGGSSTAQNPIHTYASPGLYNVTLRVTTEFGCTETITRPNFIRVVQSPVTDIVSTVDSICQNGTISFQGVEIIPDTSVLTWEWNFGNGQTATGQQPPAQTFVAAGTYNVQLITTNSSGCRDTVVHPVVVHPFPDVSAGSDTTICLGQPVQLQANGAVTYQWSPAVGLSCADCPAPLANPTVTTSYRLIGLSAFGCQDEDSIRVTVIQPSTVRAPFNDSLCFGESVQLNASGTELYSWAPPEGLNNPNIPNPVAKVSQTTLFTVTGSDRAGCFVTTDTVRIAVFPNPSVVASNDTTVAVGYPVLLRAQPSADVTGILWTPSEGLSCTTCPTPTALPRFNTTYTVTVTNNGGCRASESVTIRVVCTDGNIYMPNTFSPNNDGNNEVFYPRARGINTIRSMRVFSRWGQMVFQRQNFQPNDPSAGWNGTFAGQVLTPDVYVYVVELVCENNVIITIKGDVALIR